MSNDFYWQLLEDNPQAIVWDEYSEAFLGSAHRAGMKPVAVYDIKVIQGLIIEEILQDDKFMDLLIKQHDDNEEAITQAVVEESVRTYVEKVFNDTEGKQEDRPIFLDIPYLDSRYEMLEEEQMNVFDEQPISKVVWMLAKDLNPNDYNPNRVLTDEFKLLALNIVRFGWIQPILINKNNIIIDGFHRWKLSIDSKELYKKYSGRVPCVVMDISDREAMLLTIRMNRAKGVHEASSMAKIAKKLIEDFGGVRKVAEVLGKSRTAPYRMMQTRYMTTWHFEQLKKAQPSINLDNYFEDKHNDDKKGRT